MSFRDDHDAALARAEALENELEQERARGAAAQKELDAARDQRRQLERELAVAKRQAPTSEPLREPDAERTADPERDFSIVGMVALMIALFLIVVAISRAAP